MNNPIVSFIVPVYNTEKYLEDCVRSILNQTYTNIEVILVDDGSTDNSSNICDEYAIQDTRVKVFHKENSGAGKARNTGLKYAKGKYITFVDSDDWIEKEMIEMLVKEFELNNDIAFVICNREKGLSNIAFQIDEKINIPCKLYLYKMLEGYFLGESTHTLFKTAYIKNLYFGNEIVGEDFMFMYRLLNSIVNENYYISIIPNVLYHYRVVETSIMNSTSDCGYKDYLNYQQIIQNEKDPKVRNIINRRCCCILLAEIANAYIHKNNSSAKCLKTSLDKIKKEYLPWDAWGGRHKLMYLILIYAPFLWHLEKLRSFCILKGSIPPSEVSKGFIE